MNIETKQPVLGKFLNGRYKIIQVLSTGDFGQTYVAEDSWLSGTPQCVVKFFKPQGHHPKRGEICKRRFTSDAEALRKLGTHEQLPQFLDAFEDEQGFYLVRELIVGESLSAELPFDLYDNKRWSELKCLELLEDVLGILEFVHSQGIIHGDIKPSNLIRRLSDGKLVLIDFGVAHPIHPSQVKPRVVPIQPAIAPIAIPPLGYIPAEQFSGQLCPSSDLYALGMIAIQALTGLDPLQLPINTSSGQISWQREAAVSDALASVINGMVRYDFRSRYQSASDVQIALKNLETRARFQTSLPHSDPPKSPLKRGTLTEFSPHPSHSPLLGERSKDEAFYSLGGWGGSEGLKTDPRSKAQELTTEELSDSSGSDALSDLAEA
ncbi:serine/threonine-protein kinase, partial [Allocoleopsis sp.]|uniref:serine/threonine-protein kinase n=1 Tax=Allocoleopsis sp. TaxID=3088169 RepID=UPI002FCFFCA9